MTGFGRELCDCKEKKNPGTSYIQHTFTKCLNDIWYEIIKRPEFPTQILNNFFYIQEFNNTKVKLKIKEEKKNSFMTEKKKKEI